MLQKSFVFSMVLPLMAFMGVHKFYLSVTEIEYNKEQESLQIITRLFADDFEDVLQARYDKNLRIGKTVETKNVDKDIKRYFSDKFQIKLQEENLSLNFIGKEYEDDLILCYFEVEEVPNFSSVKIINDLLTGLFPDQKNLVHFTKDNETESLMLLKERTSGVIHF